MFEVGGRRGQVCPGGFLPIPMPRIASINAPKPRIASPFMCRPGRQRIIRLLAFVAAFHLEVASLHPRTLCGRNCPLSPLLLVYYLPLPSYPHTHPPSFTVRGCSTVWRAGARASLSRVRSSRLAQPQDGSCSHRESGSSLPVVHFLQRRAGLTGGGPINDALFFAVLFNG